MAITEKTWKVPVTLRLGIVAMAFCILPLSLVCAQDFEAVERRLGGGVEAGELTLEQASIMMKALKLSAGSKHAHEREMEAKKRRYMAFAEKIEAAVDAGKLSKEEAEKKLITLRKEMFDDAGRKKEFRSVKGKDRNIEAKKRRYMAFAEEIKAAVDAGKLSKEEAEKKLLTLRKEMFGDAGEKKEARAGQRGISVEEYRRGEAQIRELVKKGKVSKEDAEKRIIEMRKLIRSEKPKGDGNRSRKPAERDRR